jgi:hypothetical protein
LIVLRTSSSLSPLHSYNSVLNDENFKAE